MYNNTNPFQLIACLTLAAIAGCRSPTEPAAPPRGTITRPTTGRMLSPSGQIAYGLDDPTTGEPHVFVVSPDGVGEHQLDVPYPAAVRGVSSPAIRAVGLTGTPAPGRKQAPSSRP